MRYNKIQMITLNLNDSIAVYSYDNFFIKMKVCGNQKIVIYKNEMVHYGGWIRKDLEHYGYII